MFDKRVEGHQKSHKRCPFFSLSVMEKEMKELEEKGEGAEEELEAKKAEHKSELCRLRKGAQDGSIRPPGDATAAEEVEDGAADADERGGRGGGKAAGRGRGGKLFSRVGQPVRGRGGAAAPPASASAPEPAPAPAPATATAPLSSRPKRTRNEPTDWYKSASNENGQESSDDDDDDNDDEEEPTQETVVKRPRRSAATNAAAAAAAEVDKMDDEGDQEESPQPPPPPQQEACSPAERRRPRRMVGSRVRRLFPTSACSLWFEGKIVSHRDDQLWWGFTS
jgi:hypothetical protein